MRLLQEKLGTVYSDRNYNGDGKCGENRPALLPGEMIGRYIDKIETYDEQHMEIRWKGNIWKN